MMLQGHVISGVPTEAVLAHFIMSSEDNNKNSIKKNWNPGGGAPKGGDRPVMFTPDEVDLYVNKVTLESYIFHTKKVDYEAMDHLEYDAKDYSVTFVMKDGSRLDLGVKLQWLVRPWFTKSAEIMVVQTKDGKSLDGTMLKLVHKEKEKK